MAAKELAEVEATFSERLGETVVRGLEGKGYKAVYVPNAEVAARVICESIPSGASVGMPGSITTRQLGLPEKLGAKGCRVFQHWDPSLTTPESKALRLAEELSSDWYVTSSNAVTFDGTLVNIDGTGNRVAGMSWGVNRVIYVVGINKICRDVESAIRRIKDQATPRNALRMGSSLPCARVGHCVDCNAPDRMCRILTILERAPFGRECTVLIVGEPLGY
jgi:hypothetical protein